MLAVLWCCAGWQRNAQGLLDGAGGFGQLAIAHQFGGIAETWVEMEFPVHGRSLRELVKAGPLAVCRWGRRCLVAGGAGCLFVSQCRRWKGPDLKKNAQFAVVVRRSTGGDPWRVGCGVLVPARGASADAAGECGFYRRAGMERAQHGDRSNRCCSQFWWHVVVDAGQA